jgi:hypothetical protein
MKCLIKYLNLYACNKILTITAETERRNGNGPTEKTSAGETGANVNSIKNGIRLTATATNLHFKPAQCKITEGHIIINRINIFTLCLKLDWKLFLLLGRRGLENRFLHPNLFSGIEIITFIPSH